MSKNNYSVGGLIGSRDGVKELAKEIKKHLTKEVESISSLDFCFYVELYKEKKPIFGGVFSSYQKAVLSSSICLSMIEYTIFRIPMNGILLDKNFKTELGKCDHWHYNNSPEISIHQQ